MKITTEMKNSLEVLKEEIEKQNIDQQRLCNPKTDKKKNKEKLTVSQNSGTPTYSRDGQNRGGQGGQKGAGERRGESRVEQNI